MISMLFHNKRSGRISRAQKYRIKWKAPWIFSKKLQKHFQNNTILEKSNKLPMIYKDASGEISKYVTNKTTGNSKIPIQIKRLTNVLIQSEFLSFWKKTQLMPW